MTRDLAHALDTLEATRARLRAHLLTHEAKTAADAPAAEDAAPAAAVTHRARLLIKTIAQAWADSKLGRTVDAARPIAVRAIRENPFVAVALAVAVGAVLGLSPGARRGVARAAGNLAWKSLDAASLLAVLWEAYGASDTDAPADDRPGAQDPG